MFDQWKGKNFARRKRKASKSEAKNIKNGAKETVDKSRYL
jgi:hypothetical protein